MSHIGTTSPSLADTPPPGKYLDVPLLISAIHNRKLLYMMAQSAVVIITVVVSQTNVTTTGVEKQELG